MNPYHHLVSEYARLNEVAKDYPLGTFPYLQHKPAAPGAPKALIFSPHPDDEVIVGGLALRLLREEGWNVINVAVTQGSSKRRQAERFEELRKCCQYVGFGLVQTVPNGLEKINPKTRESDQEGWGQSVKVIAKILSEHQPRAVFFPHELDWNSTHIGTYFLVKDALSSLSPGFNCFTVETEFWGQMPTPNLMVELAAADLADMMTALTYHIGEVKRNPYHLSLPAWMMDNVRRGSELVGGQGGAAPSYPFATLYRLRRWAGGKFESVFTGGKQLTASEKSGVLFR